MKIIDTTLVTGFGLAAPKVEGSTLVMVSADALVVFDEGDLKFMDSLSIKQKTKNYIVAEFAKLIYANNQ